MKRIAIVVFLLALTAGAAFSQSPYANRKVFLMGTYGNIVLTGVTDSLGAWHIAKEMDGAKYLVVLDAHPEPQSKGKARNRRKARTADIVAIPDNPGPLSVSYFATTGEKVLLHPTISSTSPTSLSWDPFLLSPAGNHPNSGVAIPTGKPVLMDILFK